MPNADIVDQTVIHNVLEGRQQVGRNNNKCVVFVHGVTGQMHATWRASASSPSFLDLLVHDSEEQDFDVYTFG
jgi:hypothetical protein